MFRELLRFLGVLGTSSSKMFLDLVHMGDVIVCMQAYAGRCMHMGAELHSLNFARWNKEMRV